MARNKLFNLFDDRLRSPDELVAGPSQNLDSISETVEDTQSIIRKIKDFETVRPKVDYSDFSNFVFFNSALDYFNITGEKILNEYPLDGKSSDLQMFMDSLDGYQRHVMSMWPKHAGHVKFDPSIGHAFIVFDDVGKDTSGVSRSSLLSPEASSFSIEFWTMSPPALTGSDDVMFLAQKVTGSGDGFTVFFSGSAVFMQVKSGSTSDTISTVTTPGSLSYFCFSYDRSTSAPVMSVLTGSSTKFPVLAAYATGAIEGSVGAGTSRLYIGSGTLSTKSFVSLSCSLDDVRVWKKVRSIADVSSSFNAKIYANDDMVGLWSFNESGSYSPNVVIDRSGRKINGSITGNFSGFRQSGSLMPYDIDEPILFLSSPEVQSLISEQQASGTLYDRNNDNIITRLVPEQFLLLEEFQNTEVLQNLLYVIGRYFDQMKVGIDQFVKVLGANYTQYNQAPDALLEDVAKFFGWESTGNFLSADVVKYILGKNVLVNTEANKQIDTKLYEIKNEFLKRTLINLIHIYKTKGTRESVETLMRVYGIDQSFVRLKEYGFKPNVGIQTNRIKTRRSSPAIRFERGYGNVSYGTALQSNIAFSSKLSTVEVMAKFPTSNSTGLQVNGAHTDIWNFFEQAGESVILSASRDSSDLLTGSLHLSLLNSGSIVISDLPIFDNKWVNIAMVRDSNSLTTLHVRKLDVDEISLHVTGTLSASFPDELRLWNGGVGDILNAAELWAKELRCWSIPLSGSELDDHTLNFQSVGTSEWSRLRSLDVHARMDQSDYTLDGGNKFYVYDNAQKRYMTGSSFNLASDKTDRFLMDYNYIASPEFGWNEDKIRSIETSTISPEDVFNENNLVALEFNLIDALNEDISQILSTLDNFNEYVGAPVNKYRETYFDLDVLREEYFRNLSGQLNFRLFADLLEFFDRSFIDIVRKLIPARALFVGDEFIVESHMLERPKLQWTYRRHDPEFSPLGVIRVLIR